MPPELTLANIPQDDAALNALLDGLEPPAETNTTLVSFSVQDIPLAISTANTLLAENSSTTNSIPILADDGANAASVTAAALTAVVRLARSVSANASLRRDAENRALEAEARMSKLESELKTMAQKLRTCHANVATLERRVADGTTREKQLRRVAEMEKRQLQTRIAKLGNREQVLLQEKRKREREFAKLQKRVHAQLASARKINMQPEVTIATQYMQHTAELMKEDTYTGGQMEEEEKVEMYVHFVNSAYQRRIDELHEENDEFRTLVRAVHEELDALMDTFPQILQVEREQQQIIEGEHAEFHPPPQAPTEEIMQLPYPVVRDAVEDSLVAKFKMLRRALLDAEESAPRTRKEVGDRTDEGDSRQVQPTQLEGTVPQSDGAMQNEAEVDNVVGNPERGYETVENESTSCAGMASEDADECGKNGQAVVAVASIAGQGDASVDNAVVDAVVHETDTQQTKHDATVSADSVKCNENECEQNQSDLESMAEKTRFREESADETAE